MLEMPHSVRSKCKWVPLETQVWSMNYDNMFQKDVPLSNVQACAQVRRHYIASAHGYSQDRRMKKKAFKIFYNSNTTHSDKVMLRCLGDKVKVGNPLLNPNSICNQCCTDL